MTRRDMDKRLQRRRNRIETKLALMRLLEEEGCPIVGDSSDSEEEVFEDRKIYRTRIIRRMPIRRNRGFAYEPSKKSIRMAKHEHMIIEMCSKSTHSLCVNESTIHGEYLNLNKRIDRLKNEACQKPLSKLQEEEQAIEKRLQIEMAATKIDLISSPERVDGCILMEIARIKIQLRQNGVFFRHFIHQEIPETYRKTVRQLYDNYIEQQNFLKKNYREIQKLEPLLTILGDSLKTIEANKNLYMAKKESRTIRVSGLPVGTSKELLESVFGDPKTLNSDHAKPIRKIFMSNDKNEALIMHVDAKDAKMAVEKLNGYKIGNSVLVVDVVRKE